MEQQFRTVQRQRLQAPRANKAITFPINLPYGKPNEKGTKEKTLAPLDHYKVIGATCESLKNQKGAAKCRFCKDILNESNRVQNPVSKALADVCTKKDCFEKMKVSSEKVLSCGHFCLGVKNEPTDCPCLYAGCPDHPKMVEAVHTDDCQLCFVDPLGEAPCVILACNHVFHYQCIIRKLDGGYSTVYITFKYSYCPICELPMEHPTLRHKINPLRRLEMQLRERAFKRLQYEGMDKYSKYASKAAHRYGEYPDDAVSFAQSIYPYFMCHQCKIPYFGKNIDCKNDEDEVVQKDLICGECKINTSLPTVLIYIECNGGGIGSKKYSVDFQIGSTLRDLKQYARCLHPQTIITHVMFAGKIFKEDEKSLADLRVYKECTVQVYFKKAQNKKDMMDLSVIKQTRSRRLKRQHTEDQIQFGDAIIMRLIEARNLAESDITNPYAVLRYGGQIQRGAVRKNTRNPHFNETFGFFVEMFSGNPKTEYIQIGIYHHDFNTSQDKAIGSFELRVAEQPRNKQINHFCKLGSGSGEVFLSIHRKPIDSPQLAILLKKIISIQTPWTKQMLEKQNVSLYHFLDSQPRPLPDDDKNGSNSVLNYLSYLINSNKINFKNHRSVNKVATMLRAQRTVITSDAPCPTVYFSDLGVKEKELFDYLSQIVPNGVKSIYYNIPTITISDIETEISSMSLDYTNYTNNKLRQYYAVIQFKNTFTAIKALLNMNLDRFLSLKSFGPPKECDNSGVIGSSSRSVIEGFLQVSVPKEILKKYKKAMNEDDSEEKPNNDGHDYKNDDDDNADLIGEIFYANEDNEEFTYYWCKISDDTFYGYLKLHDCDKPVFSLNIQEIQVRKAGQWTFDLVSYNDTYSLRSMNQPLLALWRNILIQMQDGKINTKFNINSKRQFQAKIERRKLNNDGVWYNHQCYLSKKTLPIFLLYSPDRHKWFADRKMLNEYVGLGLRCGRLDEIWRRFSLSDLKDILSRELFEYFLNNLTTKHLKISIP